MLDTNNKVLSDYVKRLKKEALLKALLCALSIGFAAILVTALVCWFTEFSGYWIFAIAFAVPFGATMPLFYFFAFYPTDRYVAKRLDKLGLKERILTMVEFGDQDSYIMQRQRADAIAALGGVNSKLVKFALSAALIAVPAVAVPTATAMTTVYALSEADVIMSGKELIGNIGKDNSTFEIVYRIQNTKEGEPCGLLYSASNPKGENEIRIVVGRGEDVEAIMPYAFSGFVFVRWSDGVGDFIRKDTNVQGRIIVTAIFEEIGLNFGDDKDTDSEGPRSPGKKKDGDPNDRLPPADDDRGPLKPDEGPQPPGGGVNGGENVFDGQTDYTGAPWADGNSDSQSELGQQNGMDDMGKGMAGDYFGGINKG